MWLPFGVYRFEILGEGDELERVATSGPDLQSHATALAEVLDFQSAGLCFGVVGRNAGELIGLWALATSQKLDVKALTGTVLPYPTLSDTAKRAAVTYYTPSLQSPWLKRLIRFFRLFG